MSETRKKEPFSLPLPPPLFTPKCDRESRNVCIVNSTANFVAIYESGLKDFVRIYELSNSQTRSPSPSLLPPLSFFLYHTYYASHTIVLSDAKAMNVVARLKGDAQKIIIQLPPLAPPLAPFVFIFPFNFLKIKLFRYFINFFILNVQANSSVSHTKNECLIFLQLPPLAPLCPLCGCSCVRFSNFL